MKHLSIVLTALFALLIVGCSDRRVEASDLPQPVQTFIKKNFAKATVAFAKADREYNGVEYDVTLNDGTELDFDVKNEWKKVDCYNRAVPSALVPKAIASYVKANYQSMTITEIERMRYGYKIELANGLDLKFSQKGDFLGFDD